MRIIPAIDIIEGKCVRLSQGNYQQKKVYNEDPLEVAKAFEHAGLEYLHLIDLDGAKASHVVNWKVLETIASKTSLQIDFGGGVKSNKDIKTVFESGAKQVTAGSIAVTKPELFLEWINQYGSEKIILGADAKDGKIATNGWLNTSENDVVEFITAYCHKDVKYVVCTDISKDGMLAGPAFQLYETILKKSVGINLIASGGVSGMDDLIKLKEMGLEGVIVGKAIYENRITLKQLQTLC